MRRPAIAADTPAPARTAIPGQQRFHRFYRTAQIIADVAALAAAIVLAYFLRQASPGFEQAHDLSANLLSGIWAFALGWLIAIIYWDGYNPRFISSGTEMYSRIIHATISAAGISGVVIYLAKIELSRVFFVLFFMIGPVFLLVSRFVVRRVINRLRTAGRLRSRAVLVGSIPHVDAIARTLMRERWLGYSIEGAITPKNDPRQRSRLGIPVVGHTDDLTTIVRAQRPTVLLFTAGSNLSTEEFRRLAWEFEDDDLEVIVVPTMSEIASDRVMMRPVAGLPLVHLDPPRAQASLRWSKRLFDVVSTAVGLVVISPLLLAVALAVKLGDGGPVFFKQQRVGQNGELFNFLKFRSMVVNAEEVRAKMLEQQAHDRGNAVMFKMADDPRITKVGRVLRRYSLDELPQLVNVLKGDMSLVGPRPALPSEVASYDFDARRRLSVRPGITGLWQVSGRSDLSWDETVRLDLFYVDNWSFTQDISILVRTVRAVLASDGAY